MATEAQKRAVAKYNREKTFDVRLRLPKSWNPGQDIPERWRVAASHYNLSMTRFVYDAVESRIREEFPELNCPED